MTPTESDDEKLAQETLADSCCEPLASFNYVKWSSRAIGLAHAVLRLTKERDDWAQRHNAVTEEYALCRKLLIERVAELQQAEARERAAVAEAAVLLRIAQGFDDDDRDYERINNLHGCENNHWRTQLREFVAGNSASTALLKELDELRAKAAPSAAQAGETL